MFEEGLVTAASRTEQFERRYTLTSRVRCRRRDPRAGALPDGDPDPAAAMDRLIDAAAQAHGIGTIRCFADYFRTPVKAAAASVDRLVAAGRLEPVTVRGWDRPLYRHAEARLPRAATAGRCSARLIPWSLSVEGSRSCSASITGSRSTPRREAQFGYYVLPFLLRDAVVARVDLKADRAAKQLLVRAAHAEPDAPADTAVELAAELRLMAEWLGLDDVVVSPTGDLASALAAGRS